jgi:ABC-type multidrug transport system fused ATPase/permease subunit
MINSISRFSLQSTSASSSSTCRLVVNAHALISKSFRAPLETLKSSCSRRRWTSPTSNSPTTPQGRYAIEIEDGNFQWSDNSEQKGEEPPNEELHLKNINLKINRGELVTLIGTYGSGKTSLVNCLLGEMNRIGSPSVKVNGSIAYASQVPWIMNDTFRNNILFGREYDYKRYSEAVKFASLESDLLLFPHGDLDIIGKRGSTLSGGQRARLALARALYSDADIYILDDILSAVDAHVGAFLFSMTIKRLLKHKTVLLITHSLYYVSYSDRIIVFDRRLNKIRRQLRGALQIALSHENREPLN